MNYRFLIATTLTASALYSSSDSAPMPPLERKPSLVEQVMLREQQQTDELQLDLLRRQAALKLEASFINAAKDGKSLATYLQMSLNFNAQDADGKTALIYLVKLYAICQDVEIKTELLTDIEALLNKNAGAFSIRDKSTMNAWDYAVGQKEVQKLMVKMQSQDRERRSSVDAVMGKVFDIYQPQQESKQK